MAYTPKIWVCGETITANGLNNIEEGIQEALECCESGGDCGYSCETTQTLLTEETVTTSGSSPMATLSYSTPINADSLSVTFNGSDYILPKVMIGQMVAYGEYTNGAPDFTNYPLMVGRLWSDNVVFTQTAGTYNIKIIANTDTVTTSDCFEKAVKCFGLENVADAENGSVVANRVNNNVASGRYAFAEGWDTTASGDGSHTEGYGTTASDEYCHAEGYETEASGPSSHAEGDETNASGESSHAEGYYTTASGNYSHAEGANTSAGGYYSHAEGADTSAGGKYSHAEGEDANASGESSHAQNSYTIAQGYCQTAIGKYNIAQGNATSASATDYAFIIGNGDLNNRSNAFAIKWDGTFVFANGTQITPAQFASLLALL